MTGSSASLKPGDIIPHPSVVKKFKIIISVWKQQSDIQ